MHKKALITGVGGFAMSHVAAELLDHGWHVVGLDNFSSHGPVALDFGHHPHFQFIQADAADPSVLLQLLDGCAHFVAGAAHSGGSQYLREHGYDIYRDNQRLAEASVEAALAHMHRGSPVRLTLVSSSMIYERAERFPVHETDSLPPPTMAYGFQKLAAQRLVEAAHRQYGLPYGVLVFFNHAGVGRHVPSQAPRLPEQVLPDLTRKIMRSADAVSIRGDGRQLRYFTHGTDLARATRLALERPQTQSRVIQIATDEGTTVEQAARELWQLLRPDQPFRYRSEGPVAGDVQIQVPDCATAEELLGFRARVTLRQILPEIIAAVRQERT